MESIPLLFGSIPAGFPGLEGEGDNPSVLFHARVRVFASQASVILPTLTAQSGANIDAALQKYFCSTVEADLQLHLAFPAFTPHRLRFPSP